MVRRFGLVALVAIAIACATPAKASVLIDFSNQGFGGTIVQSGSNFTGSGIVISSVLISGAPTGNGQYGVQTGSLDFNTATGAFSIIGAISGLGVSLQTLLSGIISSFNFAPFINGTFAFTADGTDSKSPALLTAIGVPTNTPFAFGGFSISGTTGVDGHPLPPGTYAPFSTDISNTSVPEPATMTLLGTGLLAIAGVARRRFKGRKA